MTANSPGVLVPIMALMALGTAPIPAQVAGGGYIAPGGVNPGYYQGPGVTYGHAAPGYFGGYNGRAAQPGLYGNSGIAFNADGVPLNPGTTSFGALGYGGSPYSGAGFYGFSPYYPRAGYRPPYLIFPQPRPLPRNDPSVAWTPNPPAEVPARRPSSGPIQVWSRAGSRPWSPSPSYP